MKKLAILGMGHIGQYVFDTLAKNTNFNVTGYDLRLGNDLSSYQVLQDIIKQHDGVLASTPYFLNKQIADICNFYSVDYFDLTESVDVTNHVKQLHNSKFVTQCGLAPGMVSIIANHLAGKLTKIKDVHIRVGALPQNSNNHIGYYRTWNTEGLINEYVRKCPAIKNSEFVNLEPLTELEQVLLNGAQLEAATTSGGLGSLAETYLGRAENVNYKTLRYPGHWSHIKFLRDDLGLEKNFNLYVKLFNQNVPTAENDFVFILINVSGYDENNNFLIKQYSKIVESSNTATAIQLTTGSGVMCVLDSWNNGSLDSLKGWVKQEDLDYQSVWNSKYNCYN